MPAFRAKARIRQSVADDDIEGSGSATVETASIPDEWLVVTLELILSIAVIALLVGFLVGSVGIGGVLLPPAAHLRRRHGHPPRDGNEHVQLPLHGRGRDHDLLP